MATTPSADLCEVVFPYNGLDKDELTLHVGQVVTILTRKVEDAGWWKGEVDGAVGVFPENFVKHIEKDNNNSDKKPEAPQLTNSSENVDRKTNERFKKLDKSFSIEEKYNLGSLKKELSENSILRNRAQTERKTPKRPTQRPHSLLPTVNITNVNEEEKEEDKGAEREVFDDISSSKLTHTSAGRVKAPKRKPPSQHFLKENIPEDIDINVEDEDSHEEEKKIEKVPDQKLQMKMLDISQVKLREFKKPTQTSPSSSSPGSGGKPSWLEELSQKQAKRKSLGLSEEPKNEDMKKEEKFSRSKSEDKEERGGNEEKANSTNTGLSTNTPRMSPLSSVTSPSTTTFKGETCDNLGWDKSLLDMKSNQVGNTEKDEENTGTEIAKMKLWIAQMKNDMQEQLSIIKKEISKEREARELLEKEVQILRKKYQP